jgi:hypothetical protein
MNDNANETESNNDVHVYLRLPKHIADELREVAERMGNDPQVRRFTASKQRGISLSAACKYAIGRCVDVMRAEERAAG